jgi:hypothetical protein
MIQSAKWKGLMRGYSFTDHKVEFTDAYNELMLIGEPVTEHANTEQFCNSIRESLSWILQTNL